MSDDLEASTAVEAPYADDGWRDDPIIDPADDRLGRAPFAEHAARLISENHSPDSSVVYGLEGAWGSGKSSVISMTKKYLTNIGACWKVVQFTPWATSSMESLLQEFFSALSAAVPEPTTRQDKRKAKLLRKKLVSYADIARPFAAVIPWVGNGLVEASRTIETRLRKPWNAAFLEVSDQLRSLDTPILVVVDDIDRLQPGELLDLLKVVRLLGRFPGVDFLLAYDERTVVETLQDLKPGAVNRARARAFMEKIVQYPLSMPPLLTGKIVKILDEGLTAIVTPERIETAFDKNRFGDIILTVMPNQLATPRAIGRFLAQVKEQFRIHDLGEMNDTDLVLGTFLRIQFPDLFAELQRWKPKLTYSRSRWSLSTREKDPETWETLLEKVEGEKNQQDARMVLEALFPAVKSNQGSTPSARRFAHPDYFDRYLAQTIPDGDIPDATITQALDMAAAGDPTLLRTLIITADDEQSTLALSKIRARYPDPTDYRPSGNTQGPVTVELIASGMSLVDDLTERTNSWRSDLSSTVYWIANATRTAATNIPDIDLIGAYAICKRLDRRAYAVSAATNEMERLSPTAQQVLQKLYKHEAGLILPKLVADLRAGDEATGELSGVFLFNFVTGADPDLKARLQRQVRDGLEAGEFTIEDIAARFVGLAYVIGGTGMPSSASFYGAPFTELTGVPAKSTQHNEREEWPHVSWPRKREFARKYLENTPQEPADRADNHQADGAADE